MALKVQFDEFYKRKRGKGQLIFIFSNKKKQNIKFENFNGFNSFQKTK